MPPSCLCGPARSPCVAGPGSRAGGSGFEKDVTEAQRIVENEHVGSVAGAQETDVAAGTADPGGTGVADRLDERDRRAAWKASRIASAERWLGQEAEVRYPADLVPGGRDFVL
jgi:hypothetical protein